MTSPATVGLLINQTKPGAMEVARALVAQLRTRGVRVLALETDAGQLNGGACRPMADAAQLAQEADIVVVFGGDGTLLAAARNVAPHGKPLLGVHFGHFGFLTEVDPEYLPRAVDAILEGRSTVEERSMLRAEVRRRGRDPEECDTLLGMNDMVVASGAVRMVHVHTRIGGQSVATYAADGVIVASPTGSTGYSLSAGGPLVHPASPVFLVTPICPHTLNARALIIPDTETVELSLEGHRSDTTGVVSADGQTELPLGPGDTVTVRRAPHVVKLIRLGGPDFYQKIRERWRYGERSAN
jgi:Predicted sugar kinase